MTLDSQKNDIRLLVQHPVLTSSFSESSGSTFHTCEACNGLPLMIEILHHTIHPSIHPSIHPLQPSIHPSIHPSLPASIYIYAILPELLILVSQVMQDRHHQQSHLATDGGHHCALRDQRVDLILEVGLETGVSGFHTFRVPLVCVFPIQALRVRVHSRAPCIISYYIIFYYGTLYYIIRYYIILYYLIVGNSHMATGRLSSSAVTPSCSTSPSAPKGRNILWPAQYPLFVSKGLKLAFDFPLRGYVVYEEIARVCGASVLDFECLCFLLAFSQPGIFQDQRMASSWQSLALFLGLGPIPLCLCWLGTLLSSTVL